MRSELAQEQRDKKKETVKPYGTELNRCAETCMGWEREERVKGYSKLASSDAGMEEVLSTEKGMQGTKEMWGEKNIINPIYKGSEASMMPIRQLEIQVWSCPKKSQTEIKSWVPP